MSLDGIAAEAKEALGGPIAQPQGGEGPRVEVLPPLADKEKFEDEAKGWAGLPYVFGGILARGMPELREVYTEAACLDWGRAMVPVARKYGWTLGGAECLITLAAATWTLAGPTLDAIKRRRAPKSERPQTKAPDEPEAAEPAQATHPDGSPKG